MSTTIDQRVVEMRFDNSQFEQNVSSTMSLVDKLKNSLNLTGAAKGLEDVGTAAKGINLSGLVSGAEQVAVKFSYMQSVVAHQLNNLVDSAVSAGKRITSALTIEPIKTGFAEYETQINAVQTILANTKSKGSTINDVNAALDELNTYADKTIYNFTEMTRNIGTFTAAGVDLDKSVTSIKGIANLAAVSGSTSQQASTAMYQLSQALAAGKVQLMDWNSVVNAGMGGEVFQEALKRTAKNMGTNVDAIIKKYGSFRESLSKGEWLTAEVLTETLTQLSGAYTEADLIAKGYTKEQAADILELAETAVDAATKVKTFTQLWDTLKESAQSGWTQTWELIVGDFEEAKETLTKVSDVLGEIIGNSAKSRNDLLSGALDTNWEKMTKQINEAGIESGVFEEKVKSAMKESGLDVDKLIKKHGSLEDVFRSGAASSDILSDALESLSGKMVDLSSIERDLKKGLNGDDVKLAQEALQSLGHDIGKTGADGIFGKNTEAAVKAFQELKGLEVTGIVDDKTLKALEEASKSTTNLAESCKSFVDNIKELGGREKIIEGIENAFDGIMNILKPIGKAFRDVFPQTTVEQVTSFIDGFRDLTASFAEFTESHYDQIYSTFKGIFDVLGVGWSIVKKLAAGVVTLLGGVSGLGGGVLETTASFGEWLSSISEGIEKADIFGTAINKVTGFLGTIIEKLKSVGGTIKSAFTSDSAEDTYDVLRNIWNVIVKIGSRIGEIFAPLGKAIYGLFDNANFADILNDGIFAAVLVGVYKLVDNLNGPLSAIKDMFDGDDGLFSGLKETLDSVKGCFEAYQNQLNAEALKKIAIAIAILAGSLFVISSIDGEALDRSLGAITILFADLLGSFAIFSKIGPQTKGLAKGVTAITALAGALLVLSVAMKVMSTMSWDQLGVALTGTVVGLTALVAAVNLLPKENVSKSAKAIRTLATALLILAVGMKIMGSMNMDEMTVAITGIVAGLTALVSAVNMLPKDTALRSLGMVGLATSMVILGAALKIMATMTWDELGRGLAAMAGALGAVVVAMKLMPKDMALRSLGMVSLATAIAILGAALKSMGGMTWDELGVGLTALCGALLSLAVAMQIMNGTLSGSAALIIAAGALAILAPVIKSLGEMSWESIGKGLAAIAGAFVILGVAGLVLTPLVPTLISLAGAMALFGVAALAVGIGAGAIAYAFTALAAAGAAGATAFVAALGAITVGLIGLIPSIARVIGDLIIALCDVVIETVPKLAETILVVIVEVLAALVTYTPQIVTSLMQFLIGCIDALAENLPQLIVSAVNLIGAFFQGIVDALSGIDTTSLVKGIVGAGLLAGLMYLLSGLAALVPGAMLGVLGMGAVIAEMALLLAAIGALAQIPGLSWLIEESGDFLQTVGTAIGQFIGGIVGGIAEGATSTLPQVATNLSDFMTNLQPFIDGAKMIDATMMEGVKSLAETILLLTGANILDGLSRFITGGSSLSTFGAELGTLGTNINTFATNLGAFDETKVNTVTCAANAIKAIAQAASEIPNEGGWAAKIFGDNSIAAFGDQLPALGTNLSAFATNLGTFDESKVNTVTCAANAIKAFADAAKGIDGQAEWGKKIFGDNSLAGFSDQFATLGTNLSAFVTNLGTFTESQVSSVKSAIEAIKAFSGLADADLEGAKNNLGGFGDKLAGFGTDMKDFASDMPEPGTIDSAVSGLKKIIAVVDDISDAKSGTLSGFADSLKEIGGDAVDKFVAAFTSMTAKTDVRDAAKALADQVVKGAEDKKSDVEKKFESLASNGASAIREKYQSFYSAASYLVDGFCAGISENDYKAEAKARAMAKAAAQAAEDALDINSPSKVFRKIGTAVPEGFAQGISKRGEWIKSAVGGMSDTAVDGVNSTISSISDSISGNMSSQPTIRPVVDLSDVQSSAESISDMLDIGSSTSLMASVGAINSSMNSRSQNGANSEVVSAINKLSKKIGTTGNTTYNVNGVTYDDGSTVSSAVSELVRAARVERRV